MLHLQSVIRRTTQLLPFIEGLGEDLWAPDQDEILLARHANFHIELLFMGSYGYGSSGQGYL